MGPTASGKTPLAIELVQRLPVEIISVDSAMVYRGMNIGTAKPSADELRLAPHRLIDILDPSEAYSAGQFCTDARREIEDILTRGKTPLLVGGTMMYFRALQQGLAELPSADAILRADLQLKADEQGWPALHAELADLDPIAAKRINQNDSQRIQRALEIYQLTKKTMTELLAEQSNPLVDYQVLNIALMPSDRSVLHARIAQRFDAMLEQGFIAEVEGLYARGDLTPELPSIRSVGYRQVWDYLNGLTTYVDMREKALAATRQLAKRQLTWLKSWPSLHSLSSDSSEIVDHAMLLIAKFT